MKKEFHNSHAWHGTWDRPLKIPEEGQHPFTIARMTDHNVRGRDDNDAGPSKPKIRRRP